MFMIYILLGALEIPSKIKILFTTTFGECGTTF